MPDAYVLIYQPRADYYPPLIRTEAGAFRDDVKYAQTFDTPSEAEIYRQEHGLHDLRVAVVDIPAN